jgi:hypothetical protein
MRRTNRRRAQLLPAAILVLQLVASELAAEGARLSPHYPGRPWPGNSIGVMPSEGTDRTVLERAVALWQRSCPALRAKGRLPELFVGAAGDRTVVVEQIAGTNPIDGRCADFSGNRIRVWQQAETAIGVAPCQPVERIIAHELGHVLYLGDLPPWSPCMSCIMAQLDPYSTEVSHVAQVECELVALANQPSDKVRSIAGRIEVAAAAGSVPAVDGLARLAELASPEGQVQGQHLNIGQQADRSRGLAAMLSPRPIVPAPAMLTSLLGVVP